MQRADTPVGSVDFAIAWREVGLDTAPTLPWFCVGSRFASDLRSALHIICPDELRGQLDLVLDHNHTKATAKKRSMRVPGLIDWSD